MQPARRGPPEIRACREFRVRSVRPERQVQLVRLARRVRKVLRACREFRVRLDLREPLARPEPPAQPEQREPLVRLVPRVLRVPRASRGFRD